MSTGLASYAIKRIAELEATNASLKEDLSSSISHIAMLEEKILAISAELASSMAREEELYLMICRQSSQASMMFEDDSNSNRAPTPADELIDDSTRSAFSSLSRRQFQQWFSLPSWVSSSSSSTTPDPPPAELMDDSIKSILSSSFLSSIQRQSQQRTSLPSWVSSSISTTHDDIDDSMRSRGSIGSAAAGNLGIIIDSAKELNLLKGRRQRGRDVTLDEEEQENEQDHEHQQEQEHEEGGGGKQSSPLCRQPNRSLPHISSSRSPRLIGSTVLFPREDDDIILGFE